MKKRQKIAISAIAVSLMASSYLARGRSGQIEPAEPYLEIVEKLSQAYNLPQDEVMGELEMVVKA